MPISFRLNDYERVHLDTKDDILTLFPKTLDYIPARASAVYGNPYVGPEIELNLYELIKIVLINKKIQQTISSEMQNGLERQKELEKQKEKG